MKSQLRIYLIIALLPTLLYATPQADLYEAIKQGNLKQVQALLKKGVDVKTGHYLHLAARKGRREILLLLLDKGARVNDYQKKWASPLHGALRGGHGKIVEILLKRGANANLGIEQGDPPILHSLSKENQESLLLMIRHKADVNGQGRYHTPLTLAANRGYLAAAKILLKHGAKVNLKTRFGSPLMLSIGYDHSLAMVKLLIKAGADVNQVGENGQTPVMRAHRNGKTQCITVLLKAGADINAVDMYGYTVLSYDKQGFGYGYGMEEYLRSRGATIPKNVRLGWKLRDAAGKGDLAKVQKLAAQGARLTTPERHHRAAIHYASRGGHNKVIEYLLSRGVPVHGGTGSYRPIYHAIKKGHKHTVELLIEKGADLEYRDVNDSNVLDYAVSENRPKILMVFIKRGMDVNRLSRYDITPLTSAAHFGHAPVLKVLLQNGARLGPVGSEKRTALYSAARKGHTECVGLLLEEGAEVDAQEIRGFTPLFPAVWRGHLKTVELLLKKGANPNHSVIDRDKKVHTPLSLSKRSRKNGKKMEAILRKYGAK